MAVLSLGWSMSHSEVNPLGWQVNLICVSLPACLVSVVISVLYLLQTPDW